MTAFPFQPRTDGAVHLRCRAKGEQIDRYPRGEINRSRKETGALGPVQTRKSLKAFVVLRIFFGGLARKGKSETVAREFDLGRSSCQSAIGSLADHVV
jgi:hypothetical protein